MPPRVSKRQVRGTATSTIGKRKPGFRAATVLREFIRGLSEELSRLDGIKWPCVKWQNDPVGFVRKVLHESPLPHQVEILESARDHRKVAVRSGQKTGKTKLVIWLALWFYCSFPDALVIMTAATKEQIERVLWRELSKTVRDARKHEFDIEKPGASPATGLRSDDGRCILGFTVRDVEAMAGLSGENMLFIGDEASALKRPLAEAIEGNCAGSGHIIWISNPTQTEGPFYDAFHTQKPFWRTFHLNSETVARYVASAGLHVPGIATVERIEEWAEQYKRDSVFFIMRVVGDFVRNETGKIISINAITQAQLRWDDMPEEGPLSLGIDCAGERGLGDEWAFSVVRGSKLLGVFTFRGLSEDAALEHALNFLLTYRRGDEVPRLIVDSEGPDGSAFYGRLRAVAETRRITDPRNAYDVHGVKASAPAKREARHYERVREELWVSGAKWLQTGAIPPDHRLEAELHAPGWESTVGGKLKVTPKNVLRDKLGRSPDRADSLCLAVWDPAPWLQPIVVEKAPPRESTLPDDGPSGYDPYGGGRGGIDPYG